MQTFVEWDDTLGHHVLLRIILRYTALNARTLVLYCQVVRSLGAVDEVGGRNNKCAAARKKKKKILDFTHRSWCGFVKRGCVVDVVNIMLQCYARSCHGEDVMPCFTCVPACLID